MLTSRCGIFAGALILCTVLVLENNPVLADNSLNDRYSIHFKDASIADALKQLSSTTRIRITMERVLDARITKSYKDQRIDEIIRDMFKNMSYVSVWTYGEQGVNSIDIRIFDEDKSPESSPMPFPETPLPVLDRSQLRRRIPTSQTRSEPRMPGRTDAEGEDAPEDQKDEENQETASNDDEKKENESIKTDEKDAEKEDTDAPSVGKEDTDAPSAGREDTGASEDKASSSP